MHTKEYQRAWRLKNKEKSKSYTQKWRSKNQAKIKKSWRKYYIKNRKRLLAKADKGTTEEGVLYNYKEPLRKFKQGFGYIGTVTYNKSQDKIQCHFCGKFYETLGTHINAQHNLSGEKYKEVVGLMSKTALVGEKVRESRIEWCKENAPWLNKIMLSQAEKLKGKKIVGRKKRKDHALEKKNLNGTCPDQLLDRIIQLKERLGKTPSSSEFKTEYQRKYMSSIFLTFGSWENALKLLKMTPVNKARQAQMTPEKLLQYLKDFYKNHNRTPGDSDFKRGLMPYKQSYYDTFGTLNEARFRAKVPVRIRMFGYGRFYFKDIPYSKVERYQNTFIEKNNETLSKTK